MILKKIYSASFKNILSAIFREEINNKRNPKKPGFIKLYDNEKDILAAHFIKNNLDEANLIIDDNALSVLFEDATLIENPAVVKREVISSWG